MIIEKISDTHIRCILNRAYLLSREIKISELAYGTEKAKLLFRDMIEQASEQFGFEAEEVPLMIEASPVSPDCIELIITKVEDPEELDTRFSRFAPPEDEFMEDEDISPDIEGYFEPLRLDNSPIPTTPQKEFVPISETVPDISPATKEAEESQPPAKAFRLFSFPSWSMAAKAALEIGNSYHGLSSLYKNQATNTYYLTLDGVADTESGFFFASNICSEFGTKERGGCGTMGFLNEHCELLVSDKAIEILCKY